MLRKHLAQIPSLGVVVIGRNEGERLERCLDSVIGQVRCVVYVDSGSTDDSLNIARKRGVDVINLDMAIPFTAGRARNEGFRRLLELKPDLNYVQFVDGDCELTIAWLTVGAEYLDSHDQAAVVAGKLRERNPDLTIYNTLCNLEWDVEAGAAKSCGGIAMMRVSAFLEVGGFNGALICGEEPELCLRLRHAKWSIWRITENMALHDANMTYFKQWWTRTIRAGFGYAQAVAISKNTMEKEGLRELLSAIVWAAILPTISIVFAVKWSNFALLLLVLYPIQIVRIGLGGRWSRRANWLRAFFLVLGKFPELVGNVKYFINALRGSTVRIIEHK